MNFLSRDPIVQVTGDGYQYAGINPTNATDPSGLSGAGLVGCGGAEAGFIGGAGASICDEKVHLSGNGFKASRFVSGGAFAGGTSNYQPTGTAWPSHGPLSGQRGAFGGSAGLTGGFMFTNANKDSDVSGDFHTTNFNLPFISISCQRGIDDPSIWQFNLMFGASLGASMSQFDTKTSDRLPIPSLDPWGML